ncbi:hypothetical protein BZA70DRAFT_274583 [Myxozyma melibiosi]|uniref:PHD-type domain-containing protein n=1 Tax=Myxozyma melibiosi TaxID=54550 RepID=A0ABR1F9Q4_9ASCO
MSSGAQMGSAVPQDVYQSSAPIPTSANTSTNTNTNNGTAQTNTSSNTALQQTYNTSVQALGQQSQSQPQQQQAQVSSNSQFPLLQTQASAPAGQLGGQQQHQQQQQQLPVSEHAPLGYTALGQPRKRAAAGTKPKKTGPKRKQRRSKKSDDEDSDEGFLFDGLETKSGRKVHKPQQFDPLADTDGKKKSLFFRRDLQICKVCQRGHSPDSNLIVFCDGCNDPYHQLCHSPPIGREYIEVAEAQWFCANCQAKIVVHAPLETGMTGASLTQEEKRVYLLSLPPQQLVDLLLMVEARHPDIAIYSPNTKKILSQRKSKPALPLLTRPGTASSTPVSGTSTPILSSKDPTKPVVFTNVIDDTTPLPGAGTQVPQETDQDAHYMVDNDTALYSHSVYNLMPRVLQTPSFAGFEQPLHQVPVPPQQGPPPGQHYGNDHGLMMNGALQ